MGAPVMESWRIILARVSMLGCLVLGVIGLIVGAADVQWKLGVVGYFTGGILLGVVAIVIILDDFAMRQRS